MHDDHLDELRRLMSDDVPIEEVFNKPRSDRKMQRQQSKRKNTPAGGLEDHIALRFAEQHADTLRYVAAWSQWMRWTSAFWEEEKTLFAFDESRKLCREHDKADAKTVAAVMTLARADRRLAATTDVWDADTWLINTPKGVINLRTGKIRPHSATDYVTKITAVGPGGDCPLWKGFLDTITAGDTELQGFLQRVCGYALTGDTSEDALFFHYGTGANGKSVFIKTIAGIMHDYHQTAPIDTFTVSGSDRHPTDLAMLRGARLVTAVETQEGKRWDEAKIKTLTGGDRISARFMRQDFFTYIPHFKLMIAGNHRPAIRTVDEAIRRRMNLIPFTVTIPADQRDEGLADKLKGEWPGILQWMVDGCLAWQRDGLDPAPAVVAATRNYLSSQDALQMFIDEQCEVGPQYSDTSKNLWTGWKAWAEAAGEYVGTQRAFGDKLEDKGFLRERTKTARGYLGVIFVGDATKMDLG